MTESEIRAAATAINQKIDARQLARSVLLDCGGDRNKAFVRLQQEAKNGEVEQAIRDAIPLDTLIRDLLGDAGHGIRQAANRVANADPGNLGPGQMASLIYFTPLHNGTPIRRAKKADLTDDITHHSAKQNGHAEWIRFDRKLLQHLPDEETEVEQVLTAEACMELRAEAGRESGR